MARGNDETDASALRASLLRRRVNTDIDEEELLETTRTVEDEIQALDSVSKSFFVVGEEEKRRSGLQIIREVDYDFHIKNKDDGYLLQEMRDKEGNPIFYDGEDNAMLEGRDPTIVKEKHWDQGSHLVVRWLKLRGEQHCQDGREEWRNEKGNLHSPEANKPAVIIEEGDGIRQQFTFLFYDDGQLKLKIVYKDPDPMGPVGKGESIESFDADDNLHALGMSPSRIIARGEAEWHEHGKLVKKVSSYPVSAYDRHRSFRPEYEEREVLDYYRSRPSLAH